jgi:hypothetical protein
MYQEAPLPESEVSVLRGAYSTKPQSNNVEEVTCWASACTFAIDGATPHGKGGDGYSDYGWSHPPEPQEVEWGAGDYDFYLVPGVHTVGVSTRYFLADNRKGLEGLRTKHLFAHGRLQYDFQKGDRYQIAVRIAGFRLCSPCKFSLLTLISRRPPRICMQVQLQVSPLTIGTNEPPDFTCCSANTPALSNPPSPSPPRP